MFLKKIGRYLKAGLKIFDLFPTTQFIKFNKDSEYTTATGGFVSLGLIIIILILFSSKGIQTLQRSIINSSTSSQIETEPSPLKIMTSPSGGFMFGVGILGLNLNDPNITYFNITMTQSYFSPLFKVINQTQIPLVQCTSNHFAFNKDILDLYAKFNINYSLCPPLDYPIYLGGRITSQIYSQVSINVLKCNATINPKCANDSLISSFNSFTLTAPVVNTIVNPNDQKYLQTFIQDRNYFTFSPSIGVLINAEVAQYEINTDVSIMPYSQIITEYIKTVPNLFTSRSLQVSSGVYASLAFSKSSTVTTYTRSFNKLDDYLSYIGGLIGSSLVLFFMLKSYSQRSFLIQIASKILQNQHPQISLKNFNFLHNLGIIIKDALSKINIDISWVKGDFILKSMEEMEEQLDICLLIQKITFLEEAISSILSEHQIDTLCLKSKRSLEMIQKWRQKHKFAIRISHLHEQQRTDQELKSQDAMSDQLIQSQNKKQLLDKMKINVEKVIRQSHHKNKISRRIIEKIGSNTLEKIGIVQLGNEQAIQLQQANTPHKEHSKNAIFNEYQQKINKSQKQDFAFQEL